MKQALIISLLVALAIIVSTTLAISFFKMNMKEGLNLFAGISAFISAIGMIYITFLIYGLSNENTKKDSYMKSIAKLYYAIEDDYKSLSSTDLNTTCVDSSCYIRRIKANSILMCYYIERFPGYNEYRNRLFQKGMLINYDPKNEENYNDFVKEFSHFCLSVRKHKKSIDTFSFEDNGYVRRNL